MRKKTTSKGYIVEPDYDGDSDNLARYMILKPDGTIVERGIYEYLLDSYLDELPDLNKKEPEKTPKTFYITDQMFNNNVSPTIALEHIVGKIQLVDNYQGETFAELLKSGNYVIAPYGFEEKDKNGAVTKFDLIGFNVVTKK